MSQLEAPTLSVPTLGGRGGAGGPGGPCRPTGAAGRFQTVGHAGELYSPQHQFSQSAPLPRAAAFSDYGFFNGAATTGPGLALPLHGSGGASRGLLGPGGGTGSPHATSSAGSMPTTASMASMGAHAGHGGGLSSMDLGLGQRNIRGMTWHQTAMHDRALSSMADDDFPHSFERPRAVTTHHHPSQRPPSPAHSRGSANSGLGLPQQQHHSLPEPESASHLAARQLALSHGSRSLHGRPMRLAAESDGMSSDPSTPASSSRPLHASAKSTALVPPMLLVGGSASTTTPYTPWPPPASPSGSPRAVRLPPSPTGSFRGVRLPPSPRGEPSLHSQVDYASQLTASSHNPQASDRPMSVRSNRSMASAMTGSAVDMRAFSTRHTGASMGVGAAAGRLPEEAEERFDLLGRQLSPPRLEVDLGGFDEAEVVDVRSPSARDRPLVPRLQLQQVEAPDAVPLSARSQVTQAPSEAGLRPATEPRAVVGRGEPREPPRHADERGQHHREPPPGQSLGEALSAFGTPNEWWHDSIILGRLSAVALRYYSHKACRRPWEAWRSYVGLQRQKTNLRLQTQRIVALRTWRWRTVVSSRRMRSKLPLIRALLKLPRVVLKPTWERLKQAVFLRRDLARRLKLLHLIQWKMLNTLARANYYQNLLRLGLAGLWMATMVSPQRDQQRRRPSVDASLASEAPAAKGHVGQVMRRVWRRWSYATQMWLNSSEYRVRETEAWLAGGCSTPKSIATSALLQPTLECQERVAAALLHGDNPWLHHGGSLSPRAAAGFGGAPSALPFPEAEPLHDSSVLQLSAHGHGHADMVSVPRVKPISRVAAKLRELEEAPITEPPQRRHPAQTVHQPDADRLRQLLVARSAADAPTRMDDRRRDDLERSRRMSLHSEPDVAFVDPEGPSEINSSFEDGSLMMRAEHGPAAAAAAAASESAPAGQHGEGGYYQMRGKMRTSVASARPVALRQRC
eukprot:TRINITY_DN5951_c0_g1_i1.p1 TRINITY_DN5951_c0_g1~~TRINITY_DN5951_c0_g1_i1.p1  ORF type:complete len:967 (+),score=147.37 TRINITY_DN5951_c0_g1_i1:166-3066(+)